MIEKIELDINTLKHCWINVCLSDGSSYWITLFDMLELVEEHTEDHSQEKSYKLNKHLTDGLETDYLKTVTKYEYLGNCPECKNKEVIIEDGLSYCSNCGLVYEITAVKQHLKDLEMKDQLTFNTHSILYNSFEDGLTYKQKEQRRKTKRMKILKQ